MVRQAGFFYGLPKSGDRLAERASNLRNVGDTVRREFESSIICSISEDKDNNELYVELEESSIDGKLDQALDRYISLAGLPEIFITGSDWGCVNDVLSRYDKTTKITLLGLGSGKRVVNLK